MTNQSAKEQVREIPEGFETWCLRGLEDGDGCNKYHNFVQALSQIEEIVLEVIGKPKEIFSEGDCTLVCRENNIHPYQLKRWSDK